MKQRDTTLESWQKAFYGFHRLTLLEDGGPTGPGPGGPEEGWPTGYIVTLKRGKKAQGVCLQHLFSLQNFMTWLSKMASERWAVKTFKIGH